MVSYSAIEINDSSEILAHVRDFYLNLYKRRGTKTEKDYLKTCMINLPQLSHQDCNSCEDLLTKKEFWDAPNAMKNGKSPGNDGQSKGILCLLF